MIISISSLNLDLFFLVRESLNLLSNIHGRDYLQRQLLLPKTPKRRIRACLRIVPASDAGRAFPPKPCSWIFIFFIACTADLTCYDLCHFGSITRRTIPLWSPSRSHDPQIFRSQSVSRCLSLPTLHDHGRIDKVSRNELEGFERPLEYSALLEHPELRHIGSNVKYVMAGPPR
jgi:hypothetical protein